MNEFPTEEDDAEFRKDFQESVFAEELDGDTLPAELMAEFESQSQFGSLSEEDDDPWKGSRD